MPVSSELLLSSISRSGKRIDTFKVICPVPVWYEILTHRLFCRNASSTRAVPARKMRDRVTSDPSIPIILTKNQKGMTANEPLSSEIDAKAREVYDDLLVHSLVAHQKLELLNVSKQDTNIVLLPFIHFEGIVTFTEGENFFNLRDNEAARPDLAILAALMKEQREAATPDTLGYGEWHLPLVTDEEIETFSEQDCLAMSSARCCRVTNFLSDSDSPSLEKDRARLDSLVSMGHWSPLEHQATPLPQDDDNKELMVGQYVGWMSYRKFFPEEANGDLENVRIITTEEARTLMANMLI